MIMRQLIVAVVADQNASAAAQAAFCDYHGITVSEWVETMSKPGIFGAY